MIVILFCLSILLAFIFFCISMTNFDEVFWIFLILCIVFTCISIGIGVFGCLHGFIYYPKTEGTHQGVITAVDLEGKYFRRYEVYLKSSGYTEQSDETKYLIYETEENLANKLKECIGKKVKLYYGHDGGYINWRSCGTYHIKDVELVEE